MSGQPVKETFNEERTRIVSSSYVPLLGEKILEVDPSTMTAVVAVKRPKVN